MAASDGARRPDRDSSQPLWAQVLDDLRRRLTAGEFPTAFPTDRELMDQYGVSRHTAREAVRRLHDEGLLDRARGRGTFVREHRIEQPVGAIYSLFRSIEDQGFEQRSKVLALDLGEYPVAADRLELDLDDPLIRLHRVRMADDTPIAVDEVWLPGWLTRLLPVDFEHTALYIELDRLYGVRPLLGWERLHPGLPTPAERHWLDIPARQPVFVVERFTESGDRPLEWRRTVIRGDLYTFVSRWSGPSATPGEMEPRSSAD